MSPRRREALRQIAERGGTEAERILARERLRTLEAKHPSLKEAVSSGNVWSVYTGLPEFFWCPCGGKVYPGRKCDQSVTHELLRQQVKDTFPKGTTVYYNYWAYDFNERGVVVGYPTPKSAHYESVLWGWIRIKFDNLIHPRAVPIHSHKGWHISAEPLTAEQAEYMRRAA